MQLLILFIITIHLSLSTSQFTWSGGNKTKLKWDKNGENKKDVNFTISPLSLCPHDILSVSYSLNSLSTLGIQNHYFSLMREAASVNEFLISPVTNTASPSSKLNCYLDEPHCHINIITTSIIPGSASYSLQLKFNHDTNEPLLISSNYIEQIFLITPPITTGDYAIGDWVSPSELHITISSTYGKSLLTAYSNQTFSITMKGTQQQDPIRSFTIRPTSQGHYLFFLLDADEATVISDVIPITVLPCLSQNNLPYLLTEFDNSIQEVKASLPLHRIKGVTPTKNMKDILRVKNDLAPSMGTGKWSLTFWLRLLTPPTGAFRSLFFKGAIVNGSATRTPSCWLLRCVCRVSTQMILAQTAESKYPCTSGRYSHSCSTTKLTATAPMEG